MSESRALRFPSEVQGAILTTGIADYDLVHGAGIVADPTEFSLFLGPDDHEPRLRKVMAVTALALRYSGELDYRTATFGIDSPAVISQVENMGEQGLDRFRAVANRSPRIQATQTSKLAMTSLHAGLTTPAERTPCLGGMIVYGDDAGEMLTGVSFISRGFDAYFQKQAGSAVGKAGMAVGAMVGKIKSRGNSTRTAHSRLDAMRLGTVCSIFSAATKRAQGPVVVERSFEATI